MGIYLNPKNDVVFKKVFGEDPEILKSFLNALLPLKSPISSLVYLAPEQAPQIPLHKRPIVDVRCQDEEGRQFIVEMQMIWTDSFKHRVLFNASRAYVQQLEKGEDYSALQPVFALSLIDQNYHPDPEYYHYYEIVEVNVSNRHEVLEGLSFVFIELRKFKPATQDLRDLWLRFMTEVNEKTLIVPEELSNQKEIAKAIEKTKESAFTQSQLYAYDRYWDAVSIDRTLQADIERIECKLQQTENQLQQTKKQLEIAIKKLMEMGMSEAEAKKMLGL